MNTVTLSPKRQLEALFGHVHGIVDAGSWMGLNCGDTVRERDGRHFGRVEFIGWSHEVRVRWHDTGWLSTVLLVDLVRVK